MTISICYSEQSDDQSTFIHKKSLQEKNIFELEREHLLKVKENIRRISAAVKLEQKKGYERSLLAKLQLQKHIHERRGMDRKLDKHYQLRVAEVLDGHLSALRRDHERRSEIVERIIRDEAIEDAKRKEKALYEEKLRQEKAKAEEEARQKTAKIVEQQRLALEYARRAAEEAAQKQSQKASEDAALKAAAKIVNNGTERMRERQEGGSFSGESGIRVMAADAALQAEANRRSIYDDAVRKIADIPHKDIERYGRKMFKIVNQISGTLDVVRSKAHDLLDAINASAFPQSISVLIFAQKVVSLCENPRGSSYRTIYAIARVIVLISSQVPAVMDFILAELNKACIYTVPKHLHPSNHAVPNNWKMVGYREEDNMVESSDNYFKRMRAYTNLYAALIQTEIEGITAPIGLQHGWAWLAMFLNSLPPNRSTAVALDAFLRMAGFAMYRRYKSQFIKILDVVSRSFLPTLKGLDDQKLGEVIHRLDEYLNDQKYKVEPEGWRLEDIHLLSAELV